MKEIIDRLKRAWQAQAEKYKLKELLALYIPIQVQVGELTESGAPKDAADIVDKFLHPRGKRCLLLLGGSGMGKSLFGYATCQHFWDIYVEPGIIPLFIPLAGREVKKTCPLNFFTEYLREECKLTPEEIQSLHEENLKENLSLLIILDGYDELNAEYRGENLYQRAELHTWAANVIISCRREALVNCDDTQREVLFAPSSATGERDTQSLDTWFVQEFRPEQRNKYITGYIEAQNKAQTECTQHKEEPTKLLTLEEYQQHLDTIPGLSDLAKNPFVLSLIIAELPAILQKYEAKKVAERCYLTRLDVYEVFITQWFARQKKKLLDSGRIDARQAEVIEQYFRSYCEQMAVQLWKSGDTVITCDEASYDEPQPAPSATGGASSISVASTSASKHRQWSTFFAIDGQFQRFPLDIIRSACPLRQIGVHKYEFIHKSVLEFFANVKLFKSVQIKASISIGKDINQKLLTDDPEIIRNAAIQAQEDSEFAKLLRDIVEESKHEPSVAIAAANAMTILIAAGVSFTGQDLHRIRIKGADLSGGIFDSADLSDADLRDTNMRGVWLKGTNLAGCCLDGVRFGELPMLIGGHSGEITKCGFSPDGKLLASGGEDNTVRLWVMASGKEAACLTGHSKEGTSCNFSPDGKLLVSGSEDKTVRLWDVALRKQVYCLKGHSDLVTSCSFSPDGKLLASGSKDETVRLWNVVLLKEISCLRVRSQVNSCSFSPDGELLAVGGGDTGMCVDILRFDKDYSLQLWNMPSGKQMCGLRGHSDLVTSCSFSPDGKLLVSVSKDKTVRLWDVVSLKEISCLRVHSQITCCSFSPDGKLLASGSKDFTARLWEVASGKEVACLKGHSNWVTCCSFSPDGKLFASGYGNKTVRLWDIASGKEVTCLTGHSGVVTSCNFSSNGKFLASGGWDNTVRLWNVDSGKEVCCLNGHGGGGVTSCSFSPDDKLLASGGWDNTVRLWDVALRKCIYVLNNFYETINSIDYKNNLLIVCSGNDIYIFEINYSLADDKIMGITVRLIRIISASYQPIYAEKASIARVTGLSEANQRLLEQRGAQGRVSQDSSEKVLEIREISLPYESGKPLPPMLHIQKEGSDLSPGGACAVGIVRNKQSRDPNHAFLLLESIEDGYYRTRRIDFYINESLPTKTVVGETFYGKAMIVITNISPSDTQALLKTCVCRAWRIDAEDGMKLLANIQADQAEDIGYSLAGNATIFNFFRNEQKNHSCLTWCEEKLKQIGIAEVEVQQSLLDCMAAHPAMRAWAEQQSALAKRERYEYRIMVNAAEPLTEMTIGFFTDGSNIYCIMKGKEPLLINQQSASKQYAIMKAKFTGSDKTFTPYEKKAIFDLISTHKGYLYKKTESAVSPASTSYSCKEGAAPTEIKYCVM